MVPSPSFWGAILPIPFVIYWRIDLLVNWISIQQPNLSFKILGSELFNYCMTQNLHFVLEKCLIVLSFLLLKCFFHRPFSLCILASNPKDASNVSLDVYQGFFFWKINVTLGIVCYLSFGCWGKQILLIVLVSEVWMLFNWRKNCQRI